MKQRIVFVLTLLLALLPAATLAHQQKAAISTLLFNQRTGNIEVMHRFDLHDAEHAVKQLFGKQADIISDEQTQQQFARYAQQRFRLMLDSQAVEMSPVGAEIDGKFLWVYQETPIPTELQQITITHTALTEIWADQVNTINIEGKGPLQSRQFSADQPSQTVYF